MHATKFHSVAFSTQSIMSAQKKCQNLEHLGFWIFEPISDNCSSKPQCLRWFIKQQDRAHPECQQHQGTEVAGGRAAYELLTDRPQTEEVQVRPQLFWRRQGETSAVSMGWEKTTWRSEEGSEPHLHLCPGSTVTIPSPYISMLPVDEGQMAGLAPESSRDHNTQAWHSWIREARSKRSQKSSLASCYYRRTQQPIFCHFLLSFFLCPSHQHQYAPCLYSFFILNTAAALFVPSRPALQSDQELWIFKSHTIAPRENLRLNSWDPLVMCSSTSQQITLFYICFYFRKLISYLFCCW